MAIRIIEISITILFFWLDKDSYTRMPANYFSKDTLLIVLIDDHLK